jgi:hypothetical protein
MIYVKETRNGGGNIGDAVFLNLLAQSSPLTKNLVLSISFN